MTPSLLLLAVLPSAALAADSAQRIALTLNATEADAALLVMEKTASGQPATQADWERLLSSEPYVRLKEREASLHRELTDDSFRDFVVSAGTVAHAAELRRTLDAWKRADLEAAARRILPYLPPEARIHATVYPVIKPQSNSFVFEASTNPAIFLYVDAAESQEEFENTVAHELHHIGLASLASAYEARIRSLPDNARIAATWMGAFGEGVAVLAAAGSTDVHPMGAFPPDDRARWDQDMRYIDQMLGQLDQFFRDVVAGGFSTSDVADHVAFTFFGYRGPWYTVGYHMAAVVEKRFGRPALLECMADPRLLLKKYNEAATEQHATAKERTALWSTELLKAVGVD
jgi:hypothetical protein